VAAESRPAKGRFAIVTGGTESASPSATSKTGGRWLWALSPRLAVLGLLLASFAWPIVIVVSLVDPPSPFSSAVLVLGMLLLGGALVLVLRAAVDPSPSRRARAWSVVVLIAVSLGLWWPVHDWARSGEQPWAWLAGFAIAACALVSWTAGVAAAVVLGSVVVLGGAVFDGDMTESLLATFGCAVVVWLMCQVMVWLLRLVRAAQDGRDAVAQLVVAQERLRASRELHDVLGHRLGIIALKAELAADLARRDPERSAAESEAIRALAAETLAEARRAVHGDTATGLAAQLEAAELVLASAGIEAVVDAARGAVARVSDPMSLLLGAVVREAVTNVLRHSGARRVSIAVTAQSASITLEIANDGVRETGPATDPATGTGLAALAARCRAAGASLVAGRTLDGGFELRVDAPAGEATE
jgi:two-component system, NarL family, sensor histidine kinase DesK